MPVASVRRDGTSNPEPTWPQSQIPAGPMRSIRKVHRFGRVARANRAALLAERSQDGESEGGIE